MTKPSKKSLLLTLLAIAAITVGVFAYLKITRPNQTNNEDTAKTTSTEPSAQEDFNIENSDAEDSSGREAGNTLRENQGTANISDTSDKVNSSVSKTDPIRSSTGEILLSWPNDESFLSRCTFRRSPANVRLIFLAVSL